MVLRIYFIAIALYSVATAFAQDIYIVEGNMTQTNVIGRNYRATNPLLPANFFQRLRASMFGDVGELRYRSSKGDSGPAEDRQFQTYKYADVAAVFKELK